MVTGGAGFIGSNLTIRLVREGAVVTVIDPMLPELGGNPFNLAPVADAIRVERVSLCDERSLGSLLRDSQIIFNLAGNVSHSDSMRRPLFDQSANLEAHVRLLEACRLDARGATIVFASTRQVYGQPRCLPVDESHSTVPVDVNGIHKLAAEQFHALYHSCYGLNTTSLRFTNTYGPRQLIRHAKQGFVGWFMNRAVVGEPIQLFGGGGQQRDFNFVDDGCEALIRAATTPECIGNVYNLGGERASLIDLARVLVDISGGRTRLEEVPFPPEQKKIDIGDYYGSYDRFERATGWRPTVGLRDGLTLMYDYYMKNGAHYLP